MASQFFLIIPCKIQVTIYHLHAKKLLFAGSSNFW